MTDYCSRSPQEGTVNPYRPPIVQAEVEERIQSLCDVLERTVEQFAQISVERAEAEADYKQTHSLSMVNQTAKATVSSREATAHLASSQHFRRWRVLEAREKATQQALTSIRSQLDALRTISANVRASGG
jgi:hypothetical protein